MSVSAADAAYIRCLRQVGENSLAVSLGQSVSAAIHPLPRTSQNSERLSAQKLKVQAELYATKLYLHERLSEPTSTNSNSQIIIP